MNILQTELILKTHVIILLECIKINQKEAVRCIRQDYEEDKEVGHGQNWAFFTFEMLESTAKGVTSPITITFFVALSILNEVTPANKSKKIESLSTLV